MSLWKPDELRYEGNKLVCHCVDDLYTPSHSYSTQGRSRGRGFYTCGAPIRSCKFWRWSGNDIGVPGPALPVSQPALPPAVTLDTPESPSKHSSAQSSSPFPGASQNNRIGRKELEDYVVVLEKRLADKEEELRVALRWKNNLETKLEDTKDYLKTLIKNLDD